MELRIYCVKLLPLCVRLIVVYLTLFLREMLCSVGLFFILGFNELHQRIYCCFHAFFNFPEINVDCILGFLNAIERCEFLSSISFLPVHSLSHYPSLTLNSYSKDLIHLLEF